MAGFFTKDQTASIVRPDGRHLSCNSCGLYKNAHSPKMIPYGRFEKGIMCIGEAPGETEDLRGKPFQGKEASLLRETLKDLGIDLFKDCISLNAVNCRPVKEGKGRKAEPFEIDCCRRIVLNSIKQYKPKVIILLGTFAVKSVIGHRWKKELGAITKWTGWTIPDQDLKTWVCPVFSPNYVYKEDKPEIMNVWVRDLKNAVQLLKCIDFPLYKEPEIKYLQENELSTLKEIKGIVAIDYETTGLKPHGKGHKIVCMSVAVSPDKVYSFKVPDKKTLQLPIIELLENENIKKLGHNIKYEHTWTLNCLQGVVVKGWHFDTMIGSHLLDNRAGITGLKFQTYVQLGVSDYSSEITPFLESGSKDGNTINKLNEFMKSKENARKCLKYCALDSINTFRLYLLQKEEIKQLQLPF